MTLHSAAFVQPLLQWKTINTTYSECVFVALGMLHAMRMRHIVLCGLSGSTVFFHLISLRAQLKKILNRKYVL